MWKVLVFLAVVFVFCGAGSCLADEYYLKGEHGCCISKQALDQLIDSSVSHDDAAVQRLVDAGKCFFCPKGKRVELIDSGLTRVKVRPYGQNRYLWTVREDLGRR